MQVDIYINEEKLDTDANTKIAETRQVNDFFDVKDRQISHTNTFKLPKTPRNISILKGMGMIANTSLTPYRVQKVNIYREGIQTIFNGIGYFKPTTGTFNLYVYSENINLFDEIGDKKIADLNTQPLYHNLNPNTWQASFNNPNYVYAVVDYGKLDGAIEINYQIPSLYVKYIWNKIFNENGFTYSYKGRGGRQDFNPFLKDEWDELAITIDEGFPEPKESVDPIRKLEIFKNQTRLFEAQTITFLGQIIGVNDLTGEITEYLRFGSVFDPDGLHKYSSSIFSNRSRIVIKEDGFYNLKAIGNFYNLQTENAAMYIEKDNVNLFTISDDFPDQQSQIGFSKTVYLKELDEIYLKVITLPIDNLIAEYSYDISVQLFLDNNVSAVNFSSYLSKLKQKDFIKDVMHHYGLMFRRKQKNYEFISFEEILNPLADYSNYDALANDTVFEDWSKKYDSLIEDNTKIGRYARKNLFKYKYDNPEDTFADGVIQVDDQTIGDQVTLIQRPYKAPENSTNVIDGNFLKECVFYTKQYDEDGNLKSVKAKKTTPFFFRVKKVNTTIQFRLAGAVGSSPFTGDVPIMSFQGLSWSSILSDRYAAFENMINYGNKLKVGVFLSILDMNTLDFFKLKYIKQLGGLYYLSKPIQFTNSKTTTVELIKIRSLEKLGEYSDDYSNDYNN